MLLPLSQGLAWMILIGEGRKYQMLVNLALFWISRCPRCRELKSGYTVEIQTITGDRCYGIAMQNSGETSHSYGPMAYPDTSHLLGTNNFIGDSNTNTRGTLSCHPGESPVLCYDGKEKWAQHYLAFNSSSSNLTHISTTMRYHKIIRA